MSEHTGPETLTIMIILDGHCHHIEALTNSVDLLLDIEDEKGAGIRHLCFHGPVLKHTCSKVQ